MPELDRPALQDFVRRSLAEDVGDGDHTSLATIPPEREGTARLLVKDAGVLCGLPVARAVFNYLAPACEIETLIDEGADVEPDQVAFRVHGPVQAILGGERLVLNTMQHLSGVAHLARQFVRAVEGTGATVLDTRKTTPGMRFLEKYAVAVGGASNYRVGLYDWVMIKDNHVDGAGGMREAIEGVQAYLRKNGLDLDVTVEVRDADELTTVLKVGGVRRIMLDNHSLDDLRGAVERIGDRFETEASGGVTLDTVRAIAETGVDYVSSGALTHSAHNVDLSLKIVAG